jgi:6,7-dimethyl-8-ribityllumazine synthase
MATARTPKKAPAPKVPAGIKVVRGANSGAGLRLAVIVAEFNSDVTEKLLAGAIDTLLKNGVDKPAITVYRVPGAFELPLAAAQLSMVKRKKAPDAIIALGAVIRGDTPHFDYVCNETARGLMDVGLASGIPTVFGVLTTDNAAQAEARAGGKLGNKGSEAAETALQMVNLYREIG